MASMSGSSAVAVRTSRRRCAMVAPGLVWSCRSFLVARAGSCDGAPQCHRRVVDCEKVVPASGTGAMRSYRSLTDQELLASEDPEAFGVFYDRHVEMLLGYFGRRTGDPEAAADLTAETFASAIVAKRRFRPDGPPPVAWLFGIARHRLGDHYRS